MSTFNGAPGSLNANENKEREIAGNRKITTRAKLGKAEKKKEKESCSVKRNGKRFSSTLLR